MFMTSTELQAAAWRFSVLTPHEKLMLLALCQFATPNGGLDGASIMAICHYTGLSDQQQYDLKKALCEKGVCYGDHGLIKGISLDYLKGELLG